MIEGVGDEGFLPVTTIGQEAGWSWEELGGAEGLPQAGQCVVSVLFLPVEPASVALKAKFTL